MAPYICLKNIPSYSTQYRIEKAGELSTRGAERVVGRSAAGAAVGVAEAKKILTMRRTEKVSLTLVQPCEYRVSFAGRVRGCETSWIGR
jgi:hypothetical protein